MITKRCWIGAALALLALATVARAGLELPAIFGHNLVLQQGMSVPVWGWAEDGQKVTVSFRGQTVSTRAEHGQWRVKLHHLKPGGPDTLTVSTPEQSLQFTNVLVGEVWLCSGQSNMELALKKSFESEADIAAATNTMIRLFNVKNARSQMPRTNVTGSWSVCSPVSAGGFSAVAYYFGRDLQPARGVPLGLVEADASGSPAESWTRHEVLASNPRYQRELLVPDQAEEEKFRQRKAEHEAQLAEATKAGQSFTNAAPRRGWRPYELYNGMIAPIAGFALRGVIWYQGESNTERVDQYRSLFPDLIRNWRTDWDQGDFPFLCVQIAPYDKLKKRSIEEITKSPGESDWAELREAQWLTTKAVPKTGMVVITDVGEPDDIHPTRKQPVGQRLALAARAIAYGEQVEWSGPIYRGMKVTGGKVVLKFDHVGRGLQAWGGALKGFAICGADKKWVWARAEIWPDNTVAVSSPAVAQPMAVRYGWADFPVVNLWNKDGLPASPFRTDAFPLTSAPAK